MEQNSFLGDAIKGIQDSGCSLFFITSSAMSIYNAVKSRENSWENAQNEQDFQNTLLEQKEKYEDFKEDKEKKFKVWLRNKQRDFVRIESSKRLENDLAKADLQMFFSDWPLQIAIETINEKRKTFDPNKETTALNIVVGKYNIGPANDAISKCYTTIVNDIKTLLKEVGIREMNVLRFKENTNVVGGAALANIYAMMSGFPTLVLLPRFIISDNLISLSIGVWNQESLFPLQKEVYQIECNYTRINSDKSYLLNKLEEIKYAFATISIVINDSYLLVESFEKPKFPKFALEHTIQEKYPNLLSFAKNEYQSIILASETSSNESNNSVIDELFTVSEKSIVNDLVKETIKLIGR